MESFQLVDYGAIGVLSAILLSGLIYITRTYQQAQASFIDYLTDRSTSDGTIITAQTAVLAQIRDELRGQNAITARHEERASERHAAVLEELRRRGR